MRRHKTTKRPDKVDICLHLYVETPHTRQLQMLASIGIQTRKTNTKNGFLMATCFSAIVHNVCTF